MTLATIIEHRTDRALVEVPLDDWKRALAAALPQVPDDHPDRVMFHDLQLGAQRAGAVRSVGVSAGHVRAVLAQLAPPAAVTPPVVSAPSVEPAPPADFPPDPDAVPEE